MGERRVLSRPLELRLEAEEAEGGWRIVGVIESGGARIEKEVARMTGNVLRVSLDLGEEIDVESAFRSGVTAALRDMGLSPPDGGVAGRTYVVDGSGRLLPLRSGDLVPRALEDAVVYVSPRDAALFIESRCLGLTLAVRGENAEVEVVDEIPEGAVPAAAFSVPGFGYVVQAETEDAAYLLTFRSPSYIGSTLSIYSWRKEELSSDWVAPISEFISIDSKLGIVDTGDLVLAALRGDEYAVEMVRNMRRRRVYVFSEQGRRERYEALVKPLYVCTVPPWHEAAALLLAFGTAIRELEGGGSVVILELPGGAAGFIAFSEAGSSAVVALDRSGRSLWEKLVELLEEEPDEDVDELLNDDVISEALEVHPSLARGLGGLERDMISAALSDPAVVFTLLKLGEGAAEGGYAAEGVKR